MKVLLSAYACLPNTGSEEGVGWNWAMQVARHNHQVHVVTQEQNRQAIEAEIYQNKLENINFHYLKAPQSWLNLSSHWGWHYYAWQIALAFHAKKLHKEIEFDLAHHLTYANDWMPSGLALLGIPFIWGPVGGSTHHMPEYLGLNLSEEAKKFERKRALLQWFFKTLDPFLKLTISKASKILPYTKEAVPGIPNNYQYKTTPIIHIGIKRSELPETYRRSSSNLDRNRELRILSGGRIVHWKGFDLLFEGFKIHLEQTGANSKLIFTTRPGGKNESAIAELAKSSGIEQNIEILGNLPTKKDLFLEMQNCNLYALPTLRDGPPTAILEAMLAGLPILCLDLGATHELVPNGAGFKIPARDRQQIVKDIAAAITQADSDRYALEQMGNKGHEHALAVHDWDAIGNNVEKIYQDLMVTELSK